MEEQLDWYWDNCLRISLLLEQATEIEVSVEMI